LASAEANIAAVTFRLDVKGAQVRAAMRADGIETILLKGRAFADLLYSDGLVRGYADVDLLVGPADLAGARGTLSRLGFAPEYGPAPVDLAAPELAEGALHAGAWFRREDGVTIDLHHTFPQVHADPAVVWQTAVHHSKSMLVGGEETRVLDRTAAALLIALHAAHHGPGAAGSLADLELATEKLPFDCWREASELAARLDATRSLGVGLALVTAGRRIAEQLLLPTEPTAALRMLWDGAPWGATFLEAMSSDVGMWRRAQLLRGLLFPGPEALRLSSPLARRGPIGLALAYALRPPLLLRRLPAAVRARRRVSGGR
jgi:putative nucleotidyltransferase-like protein